MNLQRFFAFKEPNRGNLSFNRDQAIAHFIKEKASRTFVPEASQPTNPIL
jgi:hypothetical protein